jgi:hypothetical protein
LGRFAGAEIQPLLNSSFTTSGTGLKSPSSFPAQVTLALAAPHL